MKKALKFLLLFVSILLFSLLILLYQFPYNKLLEKISDGSIYNFNAEKISYRPFTSLLIKNFSITDKKNNDFFLWQNEKILLNLHVFPLLHKTFYSNFEIFAYEGIITGNIKYNLLENYLENIFIKLENINISKYPLQGKIIPIKFESLLSGIVKLTNSKGKYQGNAELKFIGPGLISNITFKGMNFPDIEFESIILNFTIEDDTAIIKSIAFSGSNVTLTGSGNIKLNQPFEDSYADIMLNVKPVQDSKVEINNLLSLLLCNQNKGMKIRINGPVNDPEMNIIY
ncbi:type II secretion system protein GspN [Candidatus Desantisbacteria bacterium]|nr:type II secretion system protein GspN [Candidatus Desantisbacteria bacterium]